jgi:3-oxoadipate enol-lactonase
MLGEENKPAPSPWMLTFSHNWGYWTRGVSHGGRGGLFQNEETKRDQEKPSKKRAATSSFLYFERDPHDFPGVLATCPAGDVGNGQPWMRANTREEKRTMKIKANGIYMNYMVEGPPSAPVITLSHSLATDFAMWEPQMEVLKSRYRVLRYDTRGHGGSGVPEGPYSLDQLGEDVHALLRVLKIKQTHFMGLSMGGMIAQVFALKYPGMLRSLILCDTMSQVADQAKPIWDERIMVAQTQGMEPHVEPTIERWFTKPFRSSPVSERVRAMIRATNPKGYIACSRAIMELNLTERLPAIRLPTLIIVGADDPGTPVAASQAIHEKIKGSKLIILKSAAHLSNIEQAEAFNKAVISFLSIVDQSS